MSNIHGKNAFIMLTDSSAASADLSGDTNQWTFTWSRDNPDTTTFQKESVQRISGLRDGALSVAGVWNNNDGASTATGCVLRSLMSGSMNTLMRIAPAKVAACPLFAACMLVSSYEESAPVNGVVAFSYTLQLASGSVSASTYGSLA